MHIASYVYSCFINFLLLVFDSRFSLRKNEAFSQWFRLWWSKIHHLHHTDFWIATYANITNHTNVHFAKDLLRRKIIEKQLKLSTNEPCRKERQRIITECMRSSFAKGVFSSRKARKPALQEQPLNKNAINSSSRPDRKRSSPVPHFAVLEGTLCQCLQFSTKSYFKVRDSFCCVSDNANQQNTPAVWNIH